MEANTLEDMSIEQVCGCIWMNMVSMQVCCRASKVVSYFELVLFCSYYFSVYYNTEQQLDGAAVSVGLASSPGPDWLHGTSTRTMLKDPPSSTDVM